MLPDERNPEGIKDPFAAHQSSDPTIGLFVLDRPVGGELGREIRQAVGFSLSWLCLSASRTLSHEYSLHIPVSRKRRHGSLIGGEWVERKYSTFNVVAEIIFFSNEVSRGFQPSQSQSPRGECGGLSLASCGGAGKPVMM